MKGTSSCQSDSQKQRASVLNEAEGQGTSKELSIGKEERSGGTGKVIPLSETKIIIHKIADHCYIFIIKLVC